MAEREGLKFLGALPIDTELVDLLDGEAIAEKENDEVKQELNGSSSAGRGVGVEEAEAKKEEHAFKLMERYQRTPTYGLFRGMSDTILARLQELATPPPISTDTV